MEKVVGFVERIGEVPGSRPEPEMGPGTATGLESRVETRTPGGTGAEDEKAMEMVLSALELGRLLRFH